MYTAAAAAQRRVRGGDRPDLESRATGVGAEFEARSRSRGFIERVPCRRVPRPKSLEISTVERRVPSLLKPLFSGPHTRTHSCSKQHAPLTRTRLRVRPRTLCHRSVSERSPEFGLSDELDDSQHGRRRPTPSHRVRLYYDCHCLSCQPC